MRFWGHGDPVPWEEDPTPIYDRWEAVFITTIFLGTLLLSAVEIAASYAGEDAYFALTSALLCLSLMVRTQSAYLKMLNEREHQIAAREVMAARVMERERERALSRFTQVAKEQSTPPPSGPVELPTRKPIKLRRLSDQTQEKREEGNARWPVSFHDNDGQ